MRRRDAYPCEPLFPLKDNLPTSRLPVVTLALIAINIAVFGFLLLQPTDEASTRELAELGISERDQITIEYGAIPSRILDPGSECAVEAEAGKPEVLCGATSAREASGGGGIGGNIDNPPWWLTLVTSMFMHAGILHLFGNLLFLWVFGNNIEDSMGRGRFLAFYLLAGIFAVYCQAALDPESTIPTIGASGAVAGVLGAYALLHPKAKVLTFVLIIFFFTFIEIPAIILLAAWMLLQFLPIVDQLSSPELAEGGGVAYFAHVGGFIFGLAMIKLFARADRKHLHPHSRW